MHLPSSLRGQTTSKEVFECWTVVSATPFPLADDVSTFGNEVGRAPEVQVGEGSSEIGHESLDVLATFPRFMQRVLQQHVRRSNLVDHFQVAFFTPESGEPGADDGLVVILQAHECTSSKRLDGHRFNPMVLELRYRSPTVCELRFLLTYRTLDVQWDLKARTGV